MPRESDETLMAHFCASLDNGPLQTLVERHQARATSVAAGLLPDPSNAEDAVQEAFIAVVRQRSSFDGARSFSAWFYTILRNKCRDIHRKHVRSIRKHERLAAEPPGGSLSAQARDAICLLQSLPETERELLALRFIHGLSISEIARHLECSDEAAKKRAQRALAHLRHRAQEGLQPIVTQATPAAEEPYPPSTSRAQEMWAAWTQITGNEPAHPNTGS